MAFSNPLLAQLADAYGIATEFWDWKGRLTEVSEDTLVAILAALEVPAATPEEAAASLAQWQRKPWLTALPRCVVMERGTSSSVDVHVPAGDSVALSVRLEEGGLLPLDRTPTAVTNREIDGVLIERATFALPADLPLGYHRLVVESASVSAEATLVVSPAFLGFPASMGDKRIWGYATQLYSVRSQDSWGMGDLQDLSDIAVWSATQQFAGFVLVNPLHAAEPKPPIEPSPYLPSSRRYVNPLYIRPESIPEYAFLSAKARGQIKALKRSLKQSLERETQIKRDAVWVAKMAALRVIFDAGLRDIRRMSLNEFVRREGRGLLQFATWCVLVTHLGMDWRDWPAAYHRPSSPEVTAFAAEHADEIDFFVWLQWVADNQLWSAQSAARDAGMRVGVMNDLAVGVGARSAEAWTLGDVFAKGVTVGAPPDPFNQKGQGWGQMPWRPDRLDELAYAPYRNMVSGILRNSGGIRVDHIMGLFRLWWIPEGKPPSEGAYVRYRHEAMVGIVVLEAYRAGALVVGEDLGVVEPWVRAYLRERGILGTSIAWFEKDDKGEPLAPEAWREYCLASVTTHDLPPTAGYLAKDHIYLQERVGLLTEDLETELRRADEDQRAWMDALIRRGFLAGPTDDVEQIILAMHRLIEATPSRVLCAALTDAVGDRLTQNQPGTTNEYPNWRIPLSGPDGLPMALEDVYRNERATRLAWVMNGFSTAPPSGREA